MSHDFTEIRKEIRMAIEQSILCSKIYIGRNERAWESNTTVQDIHHSIYCLHQKLKAILEKQTSRSDSYLLLLHIITEHTRPFCHQWHEAFFKNVRWNNPTVITKPKYASRRKRRAYLHAVHVLQVKAESWCDAFASYEGISTILKELGITG